MTAPRLAAALVAIVAWAGLAVQVQASIGLTGSAAAALWTMLLYFTVIANLIVGLVFGAIAIGRNPGASLVGGTVLAILLVGIVYALLLRGLLELSGGAWIADLLLHNATPLLVPIWWLAFANKGRLTPRDPLVWSALPVAYFIYGLGRGAAAGTYPYPFMNPARIGWAGVGGYALAMAAGFLLGGHALVWLDRRMAPGPQ